MYPSCSVKLVNVQASANFGARHCTQNVGELYVLPKSRKVSHMLDNQKLYELNSGQGRPEADVKSLVPGELKCNTVWQHGGLSGSQPI